jgi:cell wall-associated NlpC family hydrolase
MSLGTEGKWVASMQTRLLGLGYDVIVTGIFDFTTEGAVSSFQSLNGLEVTGRIGKADEELLFSENPIQADGQRLESPVGQSVEGFSGQTLIEVAYKYLGTQYVWGGKSPSGFDCSGFVYYTLNKSGYKIGYMTSAGWNNSGFTFVENMDDLKQGDICVFTGHVGIYIGNGHMIDASSSAGQVKITNLNQNYWFRNWRGGRRLTSG